MAWVPEIHCGKQEEPDHAQVSHFLKSPVGGVNASANDAELVSRHLLAQKIVLRKVHFLVKAIEFIKTPLIEKHEHARAERLMQPGQMLEEVVAEINSFIEPVALTADDVRGNTMEMLILCEFHGPPDQTIRSWFDIGINKEDVLGVSERSPGIAAERR